MFVKYIDKDKIMLGYYITGSNSYTIRTEDFTSGSTLVLRLQNMLTLKNTSSSITSYTFNDYENLLSFTPTIPSASVGGEYRAYLTSGSTSIWHGSIQVYTSQSNDTEYTNQNTQYISNVTGNEYIILE
jgi:hypothetical protein